MTVVNGGLKGAAVIVTLAGSMFNAENLATFAVSHGTPPVNWQCVSFLIIYCQL